MRWDYLLLTGILLLFFTTQLFFWNADAIWSDEALYGWYTTLLREDFRQIIHLELWEYHPPLFVAMASFIPIADPIMSIRLLSIIMGLLVIGMTYLIGKETYSTAVGLISSAVIAFHPSILLTAHHGLLDLMLIGGMAVAMYGAIKGIKNNQWHWMVVGMFIATFSKRIGFIVILITMLGWWWHQFGTPHTEERSSIPKLIMYSIFLLFIGGAMIFFFTLKTRDITLAKSLIDSIIAQSTNAVALIGISLLPFIFIGMTTGKDKKINFAIKLLVVWLLGFAGLIFYPIHDSRFWMPILFPLCIFVGIGIQRFRQDTGRISAIILFVVVSLIIMPGFISGIMVLNQKSPDHYQELAAWINNNAPAAVRVYEPSARELRYYSGNELVRWGGTLMDYPPREAFLKEINALQGEIIAIWSAHINPFAPTYMTENFFIENGFEHIHSIGDATPGGVFEFQIYRRMNETKAR